MLSGIGPKNDLRSLGIQVIEDLPVGFNLQNHVTIQTLSFFINETVGLEEPKTNDYVEYLAHGSGPLTIPGGMEALGFISTKGKNDSLRPRFFNEANFSTQNKLSEGLAQ